MKKFYLLFLSVFTISAFAQNYDYTIYSSAATGISANINSITIDGSGVLWMSSFSGISSYNGTAFTNYTPQNSGIQTNSILKVEIDGNNKKWMATYGNGVIVYNGSTFINYKTSNSAIPSNTINDIAVDGLNNVWVATPVGLAKFNGSVWTVYNTTNSNIGSNNIRSVGADSNNTVWITESNSFLKKFDGTTFTHIGDQAERIVKIKGTDVYASTPMGYFKYANGSWGGWFTYGDSSCLLDCQVGGLDLDENNKVWIGFQRECSNGGIQNFTDCTNYTATSANIPLDYVTCIKVQSSNTIWAYVAELGLVKMSRNTPAVTCFKAIAGGSYYSFGIKTDGTLWAWGANDGRLGDNTATPLNYTLPKRIGSASNWESIATGAMHSAAIKTDGTLWTWGFNNNGGLGNGSAGAANYTTTQMGTATNWKSVTVGLEHTVAIKTDGTLWAWGRNTLGQIGNGNTVSQLVPIQIGTAANWKSVSAGEEHTVALKTDGTLWTWGYNGQGQLGDGTLISKSLPAQVGTATNWQSISAGQLHTLAVKTDGTLWAFGYNDYGQAGVAAGTRIMVPTQVGTQANWKSVDGARDFSLAIKTDGSLYTWGRNNFGQLGDGSTTNRSTPVRIGLNVDWQTISGGYGHSLALKTDGSLYTWGYNVSGALGNGTSGIGTQVTAPANIACPTTTTLAIADFGTAGEMKVYPNPLKDVLNISFDAKITTVSIYNLLGQEVIAKTVNANEGVIDVSNLHSGTYVVKVTTANQVKTLKVLKQ